MPVLVGGLGVDVGAVACVGAVWCSMCGVCVESRVLQRMESPTLAESCGFDDFGDLLGTCEIIMR